jgi:tetratricopeptide (TPR) repeat protein
MIWHLKLVKMCPIGPIFIKFFNSSFNYADNAWVAVNHLKEVRMLVLKNCMTNIQIILLSLMVSACATKPKVSGPTPAAAEQHLSEQQVKEHNKQTLEKVSQKLKDLSIAAKASGPDKIKYLASDLYLKASAALMEGDYQTANLIFHHLMDLVPNDEYVQKKYAVSLIRTGELEKSQDLLVSIFENSKSKDTQMGLILAGVYSSLGKADKSKAIYYKILKTDPSNEDACVFLGKTLAMEDKFNLALTTLQQCEKRAKGKGIFSYYIGKMYVDKGKLDEALKYFQKAAKMQPSYGQATMAMGLVLEEQKKPNEALKVYKNYLGQYPNDTLILTRIVQLMFAGEQFLEVIPYAERLSDYESDNLNLKVKLGILYTDAKQYSKAISTFKDLLVQVPKNDKILYYLGAIYQEINEFENAIEHFNQVPTESGLYHDSSIQVAQMLSALAQGEYSANASQGKFHKRFMTFVNAKIKEMQKLKVEFSIIKAGYFENIESIEDSIDTLEVVSSEESFSENHKYYLASLYEKSGSFEKSTDLIMEILDKDPKNAHALNFLGYSLVERGVQLDKAYEYLKLAVEISPEDGYIRDSLGWYYYKIGQVDKALTELEYAVKKVPNDVSIQKHLAIIYSHKNEFKKAKEFLQEALKHAKHESERKELNEALKQVDSNRIPASFK